MVKKRKKKRARSVSDDILGIPKTFKNPFAEGLTLPSLSPNQPKKKTSYGIRAEIKAENYLKKRFKIVLMDRTLRRALASHGPADWEVIGSTGKPVALIQVKSSKYKGRARLSTKEHDKLIETAKQYHTRAFLTTCERRHYTTKQLYPIKK